jgi:hypothetical protein
VKVGGSINKLSLDIVKEIIEGGFLVFVKKDCVDDFYDGAIVFGLNLESIGETILRGKYFV